MGEAFAGDKKVGGSILGGPEKRLVAWGAPKIPRWLETYHLTMLTVPWAALNLLFGYLAKDDLQWLWGGSAMIVAQYVTDLYDGAVGRARGTGLVKWGFYMDHFLDYVFLCSLVGAGFLLSPPGLGGWYLLLMALMGGFMVTSFLTFAATNKFEIYHCGVGPTETRIVFILINTALIYGGVGHLPYSVPTVCGLCGVGLVVMVWKAHRQLWRLDMEALQTEAQKSSTDRSSRSGV